MASGMPPKPLQRQSWWTASLGGDVTDKQELTIVFELSWSATQ